MLTIESPRDLQQWIGKTIGPSEWVTVTQEMIDKYADVTGDHQWIHCDPIRAQSEMPNGKTIAHGFLILSLQPRLRSSLYEIRNTKRALNYGANKLRFVNSVPSGSRVRGHVTFKTVEPIEGGVRAIAELTIEIEGEKKPALVLESIGLYFD